MPRAETSRVREPRGQLFGEESRRLSWVVGSSQNNSLNLLLILTTFIKLEFAKSNEFLQCWIFERTCVIIQKYYNVAVGLIEHLFDI